MPLCGTGMLHRRGDTIDGPCQGPPIVPLPRNGLASSAAGGASPISPVFFCLDKRKRPRPVKRKSLVSNLVPTGQGWTNGSCWLGVPPGPGCLLPGALYLVLRRGRCLHRPLLPRICGSRYKIGVVDERLSATSPAAAARALQASGSDISRWSFRFLPDLAIPIRVAESRKFRGPHENPAERFSWGEDEHRNERAFGVSRKREIWRLRGPRPTLYSASTTQVSCWGPRILSK